MPAKPALTDLQLELMRVLWDLGEVTVADVQRVLEKTRPIAQSTVATLLRRLEARGAVTHRTEGRVFIYSPVIREDDVQRSVLGKLKERLFTGDVPALIHRLLSEHEITAAELREVKAMIVARERELESRSVGDPDER